jgi:hypothetical protein
MSTVASPIDVRTSLSNWLTALESMTMKDIDATPEGKWNESMGGCARPAGHLIADAASDLGWTVAALRGQEADYSALYDGLEVDCETREGAKACLGRTCEEFRTALLAASDDRLASEVMAPWQMMTPVVMLSHIAVSHLWYHDGQINYIQCLLGDDKVHWME